MFRTTTSGAERQSSSKGYAIQEKTYMSIWVQTTYVPLGNLMPFDHFTLFFRNFLCGKFESCLLHKGGNFLVIGGCILKFIANIETQLSKEV